jgi:cell division protein FtsL
MKNIDSILSFLRHNVALGLVAAVALLIVFYLIVCDVREKRYNQRIAKLREKCREQSHRPADDLPLP